MDLAHYEVHYIFFVLLMEALLMVLFQKEVFVKEILSLSLSLSLSPYLFLICTEGFSAMLWKYQREGWISGTAASRYELRVNHLFFADNSLLFAKANKGECQKVIFVL